MNDTVTLARVRHVVNQRKAHDEARAEALHEACESGYFENDPYSPYPPMTSFAAPCGCEARRIQETDGDSQWWDWQWNSALCTFEGDE